MSKILEALKAKMTPEAFAELEKAAKGMHLLDNQDGSYVLKDKANAELADMKKTADANAEQLKKLETELATAQAAAGTVEELKKQHADILARHAEEKTALQAQMLSDKKAYAVKTVLKSAGAHDADLAYQALGLDLDKLDLSEKGEPVGLSDRLKALQEQKAFLFAEKQPQNSHMKTDTGSGNPALSTDQWGQLGLKPPATA